MLRQIFNILKERWRTYRSSDLQIFALFFLMSAGFWVSQNLNEDYEMLVRAPLVLENVPEDVVITTELPPYVMVSLKDKGSSLVKFYRGTMPALDIDFRRYDPGINEGRAIVPLLDVRSAVERHVNSNTRILAIECDTLEFFYNRGISRKLPVVMSGAVKTMPHTYLRSMNFEPDSVMVYAPQAMLDTMHAVYAQVKNAAPLSQSEVLKGFFSHAKGVCTIPSEVDMHAEVDYYTEKVVEVPIVGANFPANKSLRTFPGKASLTFRIGAAQYNNVSAEDFTLVVTYEELLRNAQPKYRLRLKSQPDCVTNVRIHPMEVDYLIETTTEGANE